MDVADINTGGATKGTLLGKKPEAPAVKVVTQTATRTVVKTRTVAAQPARSGNCIGVLAGMQGGVECF